MKDWKAAAREPVGQNNTGMYLLVRIDAGKQGVCLFFPSEGQFQPYKQPGPSPSERMMTMTRVNAIAHASMMARISVRECRNGKYDSAQSKTYRKTKEKRRKILRG